MGTEEKPKVEKRMDPNVARHAFAYARPTEQGDNSCHEVGDGARGALQWLATRKTKWSLDSEISSEYDYVLEKLAKELGQPSLRDR